LLDNIHSEFYKSGGETLIKNLQKLFNLNLETGEIPTFFKNAEKIGLQISLSKTVCMSTEKKHRLINSNEIKQVTEFVFAIINFHLLMIKQFQ